MTNQSISQSVKWNSNRESSNEWYTPAWIIELARTVMGDIDLDPASCTEAQKTVQARDFYTRTEDGLNQEWKGRVWLNPPYSDRNLHVWVKSMITEYQAGNVTEAILLLPAHTETAMAQMALMESNGICFLNKRVKFINPDGSERKNPMNGSMLVYFGSNLSMFEKICQKHGAVIKLRYHIPKHTIRWRKIQ